MKHQNKKILLILGIILAVAIASIFIFKPLSIIFEQDYLPYGESINQITSLNLISKTSSVQVYKVRGFILTEKFSVQL